jgi:hypothetical protein
MATELGSFFFNKIMKKIFVKKRKKETQTKLDKNIFVSETAGLTAAKTSS